jgi:tellurite resistance protein TerC
LWLVFFGIIAVMLFLDLGVAHRKAHVIKVKEALTWVSVWIAFALAFGVLIYTFIGKDESLEYFAGYLVEYSLSVDNLFVFVLIFTYFAVPAKDQHMVLFWGIMGAMVMRIAMIALGIALLERFDWIIFIFGAFLIITGARLVGDKEKKIDPEKNLILRIVRRVMPVTPTYEGDKFFIRKAGRLMATPLFLVLLVVETTDLIFAVDSIPAILAITTNTFIVYTSNTFAIMGLRSLYFALAGIMPLFRFLHYGLAIILIFIGSKMIASEWYHMETYISLAVIIGVLSLSILASIIFRAPPEEIAAEHLSKHTPEADPHSS